MDAACLRAGACEHACGDAWAGEYLEGLLRDGNHHIGSLQEDRAWGGYLGGLEKV
jgi:hypothetical protein